MWIALTNYFSDQLLLVLFSFLSHSSLAYKGVLGLCGMVDAQGNPVLLCSCNDNTVRCYDLPSFNERGKIISMEEIRVIQLAPGGLFFIGNGTGELKVWKWSES